MQAKNYAPRVEAQLRDSNLICRVFENINIKNKNKNLDVLTKIANGISKSVNFTMPNNGVILNDEFKGIAGCKLELPFDDITISYAVDNNDGYGLAGNVTSVFWYVCNVTHDDSYIAAFPFLGFKESKNFTITGVSIAIKKDFYIKKDGDGVHLRVTYNKALDDIYDAMVIASQKEAEEIKSALLQSSACIFELLEALSCRNVEQTTIQKYDATLNARRINKGKLPLYEERILTIKANAKQGIGTRTGTHESPRQHLRRGHIRRLETGNIWVNACVVGSSEKGVIKKSYNVAA